MRTPIAAERATGRDIVLFFALAFAISWAAMVPFAVIPEESWTAYLLPFVFFAKFGPSLAGLIMAHLLAGSAGVGDIANRLGWPKQSAWLWIVALVLPPVAGFSGLRAAGDITGEYERVMPLAIGATFCTKFFFGGGLGEELGWRGFVLPSMQRFMSPLVASLIIGVLWTLWHLPAFYIDGLDTGGDSLWFFGLVVIGFSIVFTWVWNRSGGNLLLCVALHAMVNTAEWWVDAMVPDVRQPEHVDRWIGGLWIACAVALIVATRGRLGASLAPATGARE